jgi:hypothetical protein
VLATAIEVSGAAASCLAGTGRRMEEWRLRVAAEDASLLVWGQELAERDEILTSVLTAAQKATVTVFVARH